MKTFIFLFLFVISFNGYSQMMVSAPFNYDINRLCGCHIHKIYYFVNDTCIKYICNYLLSQGTYYTVDKQEVILAPPDFLAKEESDTKYSFQLLLPGITSKVNLCNSFLFLPEIITSSGLSK